MLTTHPHLATRLRISRSKPLLPLCVALYGVIFVYRYHYKGKKEYCWEAYELCTYPETLVYFAWFRVAESFLTS